MASSVETNISFPKVFISYNHKDQLVALKIKEKLVNAGFEVIIDVEAMSTGENISEFIKKCIQQSGITLSLISANSLMSAWVSMETIWSTYDETLRGRYFIPCNIDNSFFKRSFPDQVLDIVDDQITEIEETLQHRLLKKRGIIDLADEHTRLNRLKVELLSIIGRLKNSLCANLCDDNFDSGMEKVINDIKKTDPNFEKNERINNERIEAEKQAEILTAKRLKEKREADEKEKLEQQKLKAAEAEQKRLQQIENDKNVEQERLRKIKLFEEKYSMVFVKGGEFWMGDDNSTESGEKPAHKVVVSDFYIAKYPVTQKQWTDIMGNNPSVFKGCDNCPVENVRWNDVQEYIKRVSEKTGATFRLPTEAEWEFAARGGINSRGYIYSGSNNIDDVAEYTGNNNKSTKPVGSRKPNELGLYDMSGNVWEWCNDWYDGNYYKECKAKGIIENPNGPNSGSGRVLRGGSWSSGASYCRVSLRGDNIPGSRNDRYGFRLVRVS